MNELDLLSIKSGYLPTINASASYGSNTASSHFSDFFDFGSRWFPYSLVGVSINVPIFDGFNKHYRAQQSKISAIKTENTISQTKMLIDAQLAQSNTGVQNSLDRLNTQRRNYDLATEVSRVTKIKYQQGVGSNIEVTNAEAALKEAQTNYYAALYDLLIAKVDLDVASGSLLIE